MAKCDLTLRLDDDRTSFRGGGTVRGTLEVRTDEEVQCKGLTVECMWQTHGKGTSVHGEPETQLLFEGTLPAGSVQRYPFSFQLPHGPFTYHGHDLNVGWFIKARADIPWALDPKAELELEMVPDPEAEPRWADQIPSAELLPDALRAVVQEDAAAPDPAAAAGGKALGKAIGISCLALLAVPLLGLLGIAVYQGVRLARGEAEVVEALIWIGVAVLIVGGLSGRLVGVVRNRVARKKLGDVSFDVTPLTARRGDTLSARLQCRPQESAQVNRAVVRLEAKERVVRGSGTDRKTYRHTAYEWESEIPVTHSLSAGMPFHLSHEIPIPADAPPSFMARDNHLIWTVGLRLDIARWPDWNGEVAILVHP